MSDQQKKGLGSRLLDPNYKPSITDEYNDLSSWKKINKVPIKFTEDIIEYAESKEFLGMSLRKLQKKFLEEMFSTDATGHQKYDEGVFIAGMRSGKSVCAAVIGTFQTQRLIAMEDPAQQLMQMKGQRLTCQCVASSEAQAKETAYAAIDSIIQYNDYWVKYIEYLQEREKNEKGKGTLFSNFQNRIEFLEKNLAILSLHSNSAALAGKTSYCCIFDELSRFDVAQSAIQERSQKRTADAVYTTVARAAKSLKPFSKVVTITSPMYEDDYGMQLLLMAKDVHIGSQSLLIEGLRKKVKLKVDRLYGMHATTMEVNPDFTEEDFASEKIANPEAYRRDYLAIPPSALSPFFEYPERIEKCIVKRDDIVLFEDTLIEEGIDTADSYVQRFYIGKKVLPLHRDFVNKYYICCDQGEKKDTFVVAMGHVEETPVQVKDERGNMIDTVRYKAVIDFVEGWIPDRERRVTVSFINVEETIKILSGYFNIEKVVFDQWQSIESIQRLFSDGILTERMGATLEMYEVLKQLVYQGQVAFSDHELLMKELRQLNKIRSLKIDHPPSGSKDYADAVCRVVWCIYLDYIKEAMEGTYMHPMRSRMPTLRSWTQASEYMQNATQNPHGAIWEGSNAPGSIGSGVFGQGMVVRQNVAPNLMKK